MPIELTADEQVARLRADVRMGLPVVVHQDGACWVIAAVETLTADRLAQLRALGSGLQIVLTNWRAETLAAPAYDGDLVRISVPGDAAVRWVHAMADPSLDMGTPMKGPFGYIREGSAEVHRAAIDLAKKSGLLPCVLAMPLTEAQRDEVAHLTAVALPDLETALKPADRLELISAARVPLHVSELGRVHVFRRTDGGEEHYAVEVGKPDRAQPVLSRLHSACFTGDLIGSLKCDCGAQLKAAMNRIGDEGQGVLLYLNQEGRGIGLANKMRAYALQDQGFDTVEANHRLGFEDDERNFGLGAEILRKLGFKSVRLMTNNPLKVSRMEKAGIAVVERVPIAVGETPENRRYLEVKAKKSGHLL